MIGSERTSLLRGFENRRINILGRMKPILLLAIVFFSLFLVGIQKPVQHIEVKTETTQTTKDVREIAWNSLSESERAEVIEDWKDATISNVIADAKRFALVDHSYVGKEVKEVTFRSTKSAILGDISILVDEKSQKVVGGGFRD
jgi:hypothetical protein